jgi:two-component system, LuxR family, sensor kinase FixL
LHLFRIAQEAIHNAVRHGRARHVDIHLAAEAQGMGLTVSDDGCGFDAGASKVDGMGLRIMEYRARALGGSMEVRSTPHGGTTICCRFPLPPAAPSPAHLAALLPA